MAFYAQYEQDKILDNLVFKGFKNGIFVDVGAHDGKSLNNTLYFEETHDKDITMISNKSEFNNL